MRKATDPGDAKKPASPEGLTGYSNNKASGEAIHIRLSGP
jgi:hypothetical protein